MGKYSSDSDSDRRRHRKYRKDRRRSVSSDSSDSSRSRHRRKRSREHKRSHRSHSRDRHSQSRKKLHKRSPSRDRHHRSDSRQKQHSRRRSRSKSYIREYVSHKKSRSSSRSSRDSSKSSSIERKPPPKNSTKPKEVKGGKESPVQLIDNKVLDEINDFGFTQKQFTSKSKKANDSILIDLKTQTIKVPEVEPVEPDSIFHHNLFLSEEARIEKWVKELYSFRQKALQQTPNNV